MFRVFVGDPVTADANRKLLSDAAKIIITAIVAAVILGAVGFYLNAATPTIPYFGSGFQCHGTWPFRAACGNPTDDGWTIYHQSDAIYWFIAAAAVLVIGGVVAYSRRQAAPTSDA